jgi:hypothetical protein
MAQAETLEERLAVVRAGSAKRLPAEIMEMTAVLIAGLEKSHVAAALDVGGQAPNFTLPRAHGDETVTLSDALKRGPVVVSFYRGQW